MTLPFFRRRRRVSVAELDAEARLDGPFRRFALLSASVVVVLVILVGIVFSIRMSRSRPYRIERMELDVSRHLQACLTAGDELHNELDSLDGVATEWRGEFAKWSDVSEADATRILKLQVLQDKKLQSWRRGMSIQSEDSSKLGRDGVRASILNEQQNWPDPPPPPPVMYFSQGLKDFGNGAFEGLSWPYLLGRRIGDVKREIDRGGIKASYYLDVMRYLLFPYRAVGLPFGWILGFGITSIAVGYGFCHAGMRLNASLFSFFGLLYFLYALLFAIFLSFLLTGLLE